MAAARPAVEVILWTEGRINILQAKMTHHRGRAELEDQHLQERKGGYEPVSNANAKMATTFLSVKYHVVGISDPTTKVNG